MEWRFYVGRGFFQDQLGCFLAHQLKIGRDGSDAIQDDFLQGCFVVRDHTHIFPHFQFGFDDFFDQHHQVVFHQTDIHFTRGDGGFTDVGHHFIVKGVLGAEAIEPFEDLLRVVGIIGEDDLNGIVLTESFERLRKRFVDIFFKVLLDGREFSVYAGEQLVQQEQSFFRQGVYHFVGVLTTVQEMGYDDVVVVIFALIGQQLPEQGEIVVVDIEIDHGIFADALHECIVDDLLVRTEFIEQQEDPEGLFDIGSGDEETFSRHGADDPHFLQVFVGLLGGIARDVQLKAQFIDRGQQITLSDHALLNGLHDGVRQLQVLGCHRVFVHRYEPEYVFFCHLASIGGGKVIESLGDGRGVGSKGFVY